ncbi:MAG: adenylate/guanylate cyclase domain-containing protein [Spirochaetales bacterium]|nr:adenylate/guanylate cyclase domain-containing protein [Spirochaetales bacterium]
MKISRALTNLLIKSLAESMTVQLMIKTARLLYRDYDIYKQTGIPSNIPIQRRDAANQIIRDVIEKDHVIQFVTTLIDVYKKGIMGRPINVRFLPQILAELKELGLVYSEKEGIFIETSQDQVTRGWSILEEAKIYDFTFIRIDIVDNTKLVRKNKKNVIESVYNDFKRIFKFYVEKRNGRIWTWEGDGGLAAFYLHDKNLEAVLCAMECLVELFFYNLMQCPLKEGLDVRMAVHAGPCQFFNHSQDIKNETLRRLEQIESKFTEPNGLTLSPGVYSDLGGKLEKFFVQVPVEKGNFVYQYKLCWEE